MPGELRNVMNRILDVIHKSHLGSQVGWPGGINFLAQVGMAGSLGSHVGLTFYMGMNESIRCSSGIGHMKYNRHSCAANTLNYVWLTA